MDLSDDEFEERFVNMINIGRKDNTYKFALAKFLIEYSNDNTKTHVEFSHIAEYFFRYYWDHIRLAQKQIFQIMKKPLIIRFIEDEFDKSHYSQTFDTIWINEREKVQRCIQKIVSGCFHDVIWRFQKVKIENVNSEMSVFFGYKIATVRNSNRKTINLNYGININPRAMQFFKRRNEILTVVNSKWADFYEKTNPETNLKNTFLAILTKGRKDNTYKFALARTLLDYCKEHDYSIDACEIPYSYLAEKFLKYYWHQEYKFKMKQDYHVERTPQVVQVIQEVFDDKTLTRFDRLDGKDIKKAEEEILKRVFGHAKHKTSLVVPKFQNLPNTIKTKYHIFYEFDDDQKMIYLKLNTFKFFKKQYNLLLKSVILEWSKYLEKINHSLPRLIAKLEQEPVKRGNLTKIKKIYNKYTTICFYCKTDLKTTKIHVDHVIPWSYIYEDSAWNLVLSCKKCNCKKLDALPEDKFLDCLIKRNKKHYSNIEILKKSLDGLDDENKWESKIKDYYKKCIELGFGVKELLPITN